MIFIVKPSLIFEQLDTYICDSRFTYFSNVYPSTDQAL